MVELSTLNKRNSESVPFSTTIKFDRGYTAYEEHQVTGTLVFQPSLANSFPGSQAILRLRADGVNIPEFLNFKRRFTGVNFNNQIGELNLILFFYDGVECWYSIYREADSIELLSAIVNSTTPSTVLLTYSEPIDSKSVPLVGDFSILNKTITSVSIKEGVVFVSVNTPFSSEDSVSLSYTPGSNKVKSLSGVTAGSLTNISVSWTEIIHVNLDKVKNFFESLLTTRKHIVGIGDSNQVHSGIGFDEGWQFALNQKYQMYGTGLISLVNGGGRGWFYSKANGSETGIVGGSLNLNSAPIELGSTYLTDGLSNDSYVYLPDGDTYSGSNSHGAILQPGGGLDLTKAIDFKFESGRFNSGSGSYSPLVRRESSPYSVIADPGAVNTNTGTIEKTTQTVSIAANSARDYPIGFRLQKFNTTMTGPAFFQYLRAEHPDRLSGFAYSTLYGVGGQSLRDMALAFSEASDSALTRYFSTIRSDLGDDKGVLITITSALNDRNETAASVKSGITPGDSPSAYKDNLESLIERIEEIWTLNNWSLTELIFLLTISHPVSVPADEEMSSYAQIAKQYASNSSRLAVIDAQELDQSEFESNDWYVSSADKNHLSEAGYKGFTVKLVDLILAS